VHNLFRFFKKKERLREVKSETIMGDMVSGSRDVPQSKPDDNVSFPKVQYVKNQTIFFGCTIQEVSTTPDPFRENKGEEPTVIEDK